jgi:threonyl-tRNA synthetase
MSDNKEQNQKKKQPKKEVFNYNSLPLPEYVQHRIKIWDEVKKMNEEEKSKNQGKAIKIKLPDGKVIDGQSYLTTPYDVAKSISQGLANVVIVSKVKK